jgi:hypothetical protein
MLKNLPFLPRRTVTCPDGTQHTIENNIEKNFPLSVSEHGAKFDGGFKIPDSLGANAAAEVTRAIKSVLVSIDQKNGSLVLEQRAAYTVYAGNPCGNHVWFRQQIEKISERRQRVQEIEMMLGALITLAQTPGVKASEIIELLRRLVTNMSPEAASIITVQTMDRSEEVAREMIEGGSRNG